jgi:hypothetical protein
MKTLKKVLGAHSVSNDTKRFVDKHVTAKHPDANGNKDDVFQATNIKPVDREKEKHGYSPENDHKVYESLTDSEMAKREDIVKGMKKNFASFKQRYGADAKSVMYGTATKMAKEDVDQIQEGEEAHAQFQKYHDDTAKLLKNIHAGLSKHYDNVTSKKGYNNGKANWGHVGDIKHIHRQLQDIHDNILQHGEWAKPPELKTASLREDLNLNEDDGLVDDIVELYDLLDEEKQQHLVKLLEDEKYDDILTFIETLGDE